MTGKQEAPTIHLDLTVVLKVADKMESKTVVSALIIDDTNRFLVQRRSATRRLFPNCWDFVGGHVETGETDAQALSREIREETGWSFKEVVKEISPKIWFDATVRTTERQFIVRVTGDLTQPNLEAGKATEFRWIEKTDCKILLENRTADDDFVFKAAEEAFNLLDETVSNGQ